MRKKYDINYYDREKAISRNKYFNNAPIFYKKGVDTNKIFFDYILNEINVKANNKLSILDLGTGTGYVPKTLCRICQKNFSITGIDLSKDMIDAARRENADKRIVYKIADNRKLPFRSESFDIITNKLSTQFNIQEVNRVLKKDGIFIFKEYGPFKGFKEIKKMFGKKFRSGGKSTDKCVTELYKLGFDEIIKHVFLIKRKYGPNEIKQIFSMANLIENFNEADLQKIKDKLLKNGKITVTSDPFIIFARK